MTDSPKQQGSASGRAVRTVLADLAIMAAVVLVVEVLLRLLAPQPTERLLRGVYEGTETGFWYRPGTTAIANNGFGDHRFSINRWRARDREYGDKQPDEWRILVVGNSFSDNQALEVEEIYPNVLEADLAETHPRRSYSVINAGRAGWELWQYQEYLEAMLPDMRPDVVIVAVVPANHLAASARPSRRRAFTTWHGLPVPVHASYLSRLKWGLWRVGEALEDHSHAYVALRRLTHIPGQWTGITKVTAFGPLITDPDTVERVRGPATEALAAIRDTCRAHGARMLILNVPRMYEADAGGRRLKIELDRPNLATFDATRPSRLLAEIAAELGTPAYDPIPELEASEEPTYLPIFEHWNALGNRIVARGLKRFLEAEGALGPPGRGGTGEPPPTGTGGPQETR
jgi:hypothetical protein